MSKHLLLFCAAMTAATLSHAQFDSLEVKAGLQARISSAGYQPFWLVANKYGTVADRQSDLSPYVRVKGKFVIAEPEYQNDHGFYDYNEVALLYGISVYNNNHFGNTLLEEGYLKLEYKNWSLRAGRFEETSGGIDPGLSTGSLGISSNALPIPKVGIAVKDFTAVPFTGRWLQFKGSFAHGWLGDQRYIKNSYYHEKTFFLQFGLRKLKLYAGIEHFAEWGGNRGDQQIDKSMKGFWDAVLAKNDGDASPSEDGGHHGDQRGVLQGGFYWENDAVKFHGYLQKPFEGRNDITIRNKRALAGLAVNFKNKYLGLQKLVAEFISTKGIDQQIVATRRESLYNNSIYKTGWEYRNSVIGTPLVLNRTRANNYFPEIIPFNWNGPDTIPGNSNIINNSITGLHVGATYYISDYLGGKTLLTYTSNGGTETSHPLFSPARKQIYGLQQFSYELPNNFTLTAGVGFEFGELSNKMVAGLLVGVEWNITGGKDFY